jgi:guanylate kinase
MKKEQALGGISKGQVFVVSAPAGTGKTTLVRLLVKEFDCVVESVSCTTRPPRKGEKEGVDYFFLTQEAFDKKMEQGEFLEHAKVFDHSYGTSRQFLEERLLAGKHVVLVIDTQGALQLMGTYAAVFVFISPPSMEALRSRLQARRSESEESMERRLSWAQKEMALASRYDYHIVNDDLQVAYEVLRSILIAEQHKID